MYLGRANNDDSSLVGQHYQQLFEHHPVPMWCYSTTELRVLAVNDAAVAVYGWSRDAILDRDLTGLWPAAERELLRQRLIDMPETLTCGGRTRHQCQSGALREVEVTSFVLAPPDDSVRVLIAREVSGTERTEQSLRDSETFLRSVFDSLAPLTAILDRDGRIVAVNLAWRRSLIAYGVAADGYCEGADYLAVCERAEGPDGDMARTVATGIRAVLARQVSEFNFEYPCHGKTGANWFAVKVRPFADGEQAHILMSHENITERRLGEERLRNSARMLDMTTRLARVGGWRSDLGSDRVYWSDELCRILKQPPGTCVSVADGIRFYAPEWQARMRSTFIACAWGGEPFDEEVEIINGDGERVWVRSLGQAIRDDSGAIVGVQGALKDIALQRASEARLRQLSQAIEQSPESIVITDLEANIEYVNEAFTRISGYAANEVLGRNSSMLGSGETPGRTHSAMWSALRRGQPWQGEFHNRRKDGTRYIEYAVIGPLREADGRIKNYVATKVDITNYKRIDHELAEHREHLERLVAERTAELAEARAQADSANLAKSAFLANMSHEIRTPMNGVLGLLEVLAQSELDAHQADLIATISDSGNALLGIIDDILDFSKIEAGRLDLEVAPFSVVELVHGLCHTLAPLATRKQVDLEVFVDSTIPAHVSGDGLRLRQILFNLLGNALKFSGDRSEVRGQVSLRVTRPADEPLRLVFTVRDNGVGMNSETQARLFLPFMQAESSTTRRYGGTGLGLSICRRLIELMDGTITLESQLQLGSTFIVTLPFAVAECAPEVRPPNPTASNPPLPLTLSTVLESRARGQLILVAEDDVVNQKVIVQQLALLGCTAEVADNGIDALRLWRGGGHALLLTDMHMPEMDGLTLTRAIRQFEEELGCPLSARLPIVALTANALRGEAENARAAGMDDYLTKPLKLAELRRVIATLGIHANGSIATAPAVESPRSSMSSAETGTGAALAAYDDAVLRALVGDEPAIVCDLLNEFLQAATRYREELRTAATQLATVEIGSIAHRLRASAGAVGALALSEAAARAEFAVRSDNSSLPDRLSQLDAALVVAIAAIAAACDDSSHPLSDKQETDHE